MEKPESKVTARIKAYNMIAVWHADGTFRVTESYATSPLVEIVIAGHEHEDALKALKQEARKRRSYKTPRHQMSIVCNLFSL